jgi:hypothetical protein
MYPGKIVFEGIRNCDGFLVTDLGIASRFLTGVIEEVDEVLE